MALTLAPSPWIIGAVRRLSERGSTLPAAATLPATMSFDAIVWAVETASRFVPRATCLTQALAAQILLLHHGHAATFCLGVPRASARPFRAHAWLELDGNIILGGEESRQLVRLSTLASFESTPSMNRVGHDADRTVGPGR